jgi:hypothetical protein
MKALTVARLVNELSLGGFAGEFLPAGCNFDPRLLS